MHGYPHHIDLTVSDLKRSVAFYEKVLSEIGFRRSDQYSGGAPCWLYGQSVNGVFSIALQLAREAVPHDRYRPGLHHMAFGAESREAVDRFHDFLLGQEIDVLDAPAEYDYTPGYYAVFFADPDGIKLELVYEPHPERPT